MKSKLRLAQAVQWQLLEDVSINNEYEYENDFKPYSYSKSFSQLSMLAMTPSSSLWKIKLWDSALLGAKFDRIILI